MVLPQRLNRAPQLEELAHTAPLQKSIGHQATGDERWQAYFRLAKCDCRRFSSGVNAVQSLPQPGFFRFTSARSTSQVAATATMMSARTVWSSCDTLETQGATTLKNNQRQNPGGASHVGSLEDRPLPSVRLALHDRDGAHALHGEDVKDHEGETD
jgi:hypothetical protein